MLLILKSTTNVFVSILFVNLLPKKFGFMEWLLFQKEEENEKTLNAESLLSEAIMEQRPKEKDNKQFNK